MHEGINLDRRRFLSVAAMTVAGGIGHNLSQEAPQALADAIIDVNRP